MTDERTNEQISAEIAERLFENPIEWRMVAGKPFASDYNAALGLVVPEMRERGYEFASMDRDGEFRCSFYRPKSNILDVVIGVPFGEEPRAICLAALAALDTEEAQG